MLVARRVYNPADLRVLNCLVVTATVTRTSPRIPNSSITILETAFSTQSWVKDYRV